MKAITLDQPWASLVSINKKNIITRPYPTKYRGPLAIHSSKLTTTIFDPYFRSVLTENGLSCDNLPIGQILAICKLADCWLITPSNSPCYPEYAFSEFKVGWYSWELADIRALSPPVEAKGHRGLWDWEMPT